MTEEESRMSVDTFLGMFALVRAGHDKGRTYLIIKEEGDFVYLADGKNRGQDNPRKKRRKHVQVIKKRNEELTGRLRSGKTIYNEEIRFAIRNLQSESEEVI